jgi:hypothetical protein
MMPTAYIHLSDEETQALRQLEQQTGKTQDELLHEAIRHFLTYGPPVNRLDLLRQARGIWKDRIDLPDLRTLRAEFDRFPTSE